MGIPIPALRITALPLLRLQLALLMFLIVTLLTPRQAWAKEGYAGIQMALVKIEAQIRPPDNYNPWQYKDQNRIIGSGVIIAGARILTNAHLVTDSVYIEVKKTNDPVRYIAHLEAIGPQCDLAILKVEDPSFFHNTKSLELGGLPDLLDEVAVFGFPEGGEELSITRGVVSRIEVMTYVHSMVDLLGVQIDAAINPGNSGGPVLMDGKIIGVAMQSLAQGENIGYIIPTPIIRHFLDDVKDGKFDGFPDDGLLVQPMHNEDLREYYGMKKGEGGVLVVDVAYGSSSWGFIKPDDVLVSIGGQAVARDGSVQLSDQLRVHGSYLVQKKHIGEKIQTQVVRGGKLLNLDLLLKSSPGLVPLRLDGKPDYFIHGGFVFMPLTMNFIWEWGGNWQRDAPADLVTEAEKNLPKPDRREVVILRSALAHRINAGYQEVFNMIISKVNGQKIADMDEFVRAIVAAKGKSILLASEAGLKVVIDREKAARAEAEILETYAIPRPMSERFSKLKKGKGSQEVGMETPKPAGRK